MSDRSWIQQSPGKKGINRNSLSLRTDCSQCWSAVNGRDVNLVADSENTHAEHRKHTVLTHRKHSSLTTKQPAAANYSKLWHSSCSRNCTGSAVGEARTNRAAPEGHQHTAAQTTKHKSSADTAAHSHALWTLIQISRGDSAISWLHTSANNSVCSCKIER